MAIKAIILDIGGIIINESGTTARDIVSKKFNLEPQKFKEYSIKNLNKSFKGWDAKDFFKGLIQENNLKATPEEMIEEWQKARALTSSWNIKNKKILEKLNESYLTISFTNSTKLNDSVQIRQDSYKLFKINLISHQLRKCKPEKDFYKALIQTLKENNITPTESVYVDNEERNLTPAKELGINTILLTETTNLKEELTKLGVKI